MLAAGSDSVCRIWKDPCPTDYYATSCINGEAIKDKDGGHVQFMKHESIVSSIDTPRPSLKASSSLRAQSPVLRKGTTGLGSKGHPPPSSSLTPSTMTLQSPTSLSPSHGSPMGPNCLELRGHADVIEAVAWHPTNPNMLATASSDKSIRFWDLSRSQGNYCVNVIYTPGKNVRLAWKPQGDFLGYSTKENLLGFIDLRKMNTPYKKQFPFEIHEFCFSPSGMDFYLTSGRGKLYILDWLTLQEKQCIIAHSSNVYNLKMLADGSKFVTAGGDLLVLIWNTLEKIVCRSISRIETPVRNLDVSRDGRFVAICPNDAMIDISCLKTGEQILKIETGGPNMNAVAWNPVYPHVLAYGGGDFNVGIYGLGKSPDGLIRIIKVDSS